MADAMRKVADLDVAAEFGLRVPRRAWVVLIPAAVSMLLLFAPALVPQIAQAQVPWPWPKQSPRQAERPSHQEDFQPTAIDR